MTKYNHLFHLTFICLSEQVTAEDATGAQLRAAILVRLDGLTDDELYEDVGHPCDTDIVED